MSNGHLESILGIFKQYTAEKLKPYVQEVEIAALRDDIATLFILNAKLEAKVKEQGISLKMMSDQAAGFQKLLDTHEVKFEDIQGQIGKLTDLYTELATT